MIICDYNFKCLEYEQCPHELTCGIPVRINHMARKHYNRHANTKKKKGWDQQNPSVPELMHEYGEALRNGFRCPYCNCEMTLDREYLNSSTIDHIIPRALGGNSRADNVVVCCNECNRRKSVKENTIVNKTRNGEQIPKNTIMRSFYRSTLNREMKRARGGIYDRSINP
jgi:5-methylcytosine-specific restriction endonuclease McrA